MANTFVQPNFSTVGNLSGFGPTPPRPRGWGGSGSLFGNYWMGDWLWDALTGSGARNQPGSVAPSTRTGPAPSGTSNLSSSSTPIRPGGYTDAFGRELWGKAIRAGTISGPYTPAVGRELWGKAVRARPSGMTREGAPLGSPAAPYYPPMPPANRPTAQYYDQAALTAAAPHAGVRPGWYTPGEIDRFAGVMGPDQLRGLLPMIQAEQQRLGAGTPTALPEPGAWLRANYPNIPPYDIESAPNALSNPDAWSQNFRGVEGAAERYRNLPTTTTPGNAGQWQALTRMFPGLGYQGNRTAEEANAFAGQVLPGYAPFRTPEQLAAWEARNASIRAGTYVPPSQSSAPTGMGWFNNPIIRNRPGSGGFSLRPLSAFPGYQPPPPTSYRGGVVR